MREAARAKSLQALLVTSSLVASMSAEGGESRRERVTLSVKAHGREEAHGPRLEEWRGGALSPRVMDPGRLVVEAGDEVIGPTKARLLGFLFNHSPGTQVIEVEEARILEETKRLRAAFKLPEDLSRGAP